MNYHTNPRGLTRLSQAALFAARGQSGLSPVPGLSPVYPFPPQFSSLKLKLMFVL
jgi:hypothetical protein